MANTDITDTNILHQAMISDDSFRFAYAMVTDVPVSGDRTAGYMFGIVIDQHGFYSDDYKSIRERCRRVNLWSLVSYDRLGLDLILDRMAS